MEKRIDVALAIEQIYPPDAAGGAAKYLEAGTYEALVATWQDERPVPSHAEILAAWEQVRLKQEAQTQVIQARDTSPLFSMDIEELMLWAEAQDELTFRRELVKAFVHLRELAPRNRRFNPR